MEKIIASGRNLQTAILQGLKKLDTTEENVEYEIICAGGLFKACKIEMWKKQTEGNKYQEFLQTVLTKAGFDAKVEKTEDEKTVLLNIICDKSGDIIGHRGDTLESLRFLTAISVKAEESFKQVIVDCNNYRQKRAETLEKLAKNLEQKVIRTGRKVRLEPMNSYERRILHSALKDSVQVETHSEGAEPFRYIVIQKRGFNNYNKKHRTPTLDTTAEETTELTTPAQDNRPKRKQLNFVYRTKTKKRF